jgi:hypothetical protein
MNIFRLEPFMQGLEAIRHGQSFSVYGISNVPKEVLTRAVNLYMRFDRDPVAYLLDWNRFQKEKQRDQVQ